VEDLDHETLSTETEISHSIIQDFDGLMIDKNSNPTNKKKETERFYLNEFLGVLGIAPDYIHQGESPDFIITLKTKRLGIELTYFHSNARGECGRTRREIEESWKSLKRKIMEKVERYEKLNETHGLLHFRKLELPHRARNEEFCDQLVDLSLRMINSNRERTSPDETYPLLKRYLKEFVLEKVGCYINWDWNHDTDWVGLRERELINIITPKVGKVANYRKKSLDELWLLIISGHRLSQAMGMRLSYKLKAFDQLDSLLEKSGYDKVYIYQYISSVRFTSQ